MSSIASIDFIWSDPFDFDITFKNIINLGFKIQNWSITREMCHEGCFNQVEIYVYKPILLITIHIQTDVEITITTQYKKEQHHDL